MRELDMQIQPIPATSTKIDDLLSIPSTYNNQCVITMVNSITRKEIESVNCFWCRHPFTNTPIGCPIRYVCSSAVQTHLSEITKEKYFIRQEITERESAHHPINDNTKFIDRDYYETDGCFCSFECCLAYIDENIQNPLYSQSKHLLSKMICDTYGEDTVQNILKAPSWRLLADYGGIMDIHSFRSRCKTHRYDQIDRMVTDLPRLMPVGWVFQEHYVLL